MLIIARRTGHRKTDDLRGKKIAWSWAPASSPHIYLTTSQIDRRT